MGAGRPTLAQVAALAGVSLASASRALSGASASPEMLERVRRAAEELRYVPDVMARSLKVRRTEQIALAVADLGNPVYLSMMRGIESVVREAGYRLVLSSTGSDPDVEADIVRSLARGYADGLIISPLRMTDSVVEELARAPVPVVVVGSLPRGVDLDNVRTNSVRGVGLAMDHLVSLGRRAIGFVNGPVDTVPGAARLRGFDRAARRLDLPADPELRVTAADFTAAAGEEAVARLLRQSTPDALVCANDLIAAGAIRAITAHGLTVPGDISVTGMDDTELTELVTPTLTSVSLGSADRGRLAAELLLGRLRDPDRAARRTTVQPRLVVRNSTARRGSGRRGRRT